MIGASGVTGGVICSCWGCLLQTESMYLFEGVIGGVRRASEQLTTKVFSFVVPQCFLKNEWLCAYSEVGGHIEEDSNVNEESAIIVVNNRPFLLETVLDDDIVTVGEKYNRPKKKVSVFFSMSHFGTSARGLICE